VESTAPFGKGYSDAYKAIFAPVDDANRITDPNVILQRAAPGGDLTRKGATRLLEVMKESRKDVDKQTAHQNFTGIMSQFEETSGAGKDSTDPYAKALYHEKIFPALSNQFSDVLERGDKADVRKFIDELPERAKKLAASLDAPEQRNARRMDALLEQARVNAETAAVTAASGVPKDPEFARTGVKPENWTQAMALPRPGGLTPENWAKVLRRVAISPTS